MMKNIKNRSQDSYEYQMSLKRKNLQENTKGKTKIIKNQDRNNCRRLEL